MTFVTGTDTVTASTNSMGQDSDTHQSTAPHLPQQSIQPLHTQTEEAWEVAYSTTGTFIAATAMGVTHTAAP